jgi:hypothetical protein
VRRSLALVLAMLAAGALAPAQARPAHPGGPPLAAQPHSHAPTWAELTPRQQADLAKLEHNWDRMPPQRRVHILRHLQRWEQLPPEQQETLREGRRNFRELSPRQRERMRESMQALRELPPEEQQRLRALWRGMTPEQRREWLRRGGPGLAAPP